MARVAWGQRPQVADDAVWAGSVSAADRKGRSVIEWLVICFAFFGTVMHQRNSREHIDVCVVLTDSGARVAVHGTGSIAISVTPEAAQVCKLCLGEMIV